MRKLFGSVRSVVGFFSRKENMNKIKFIAILFFAILTSCSSAEKSSPSFGLYDIGGNSSVAQNDNLTGEEPANAPLAQVSLEQADKSQTQPAAVERKIIRNADLQLETNAPEEAQNKIAAIAESKGGFVIESTQSSSNAKATTRDTVTMTVRVPAAKFNESLDEIRKAGNRVIGETVKGQDVTEEFIDIEANLKAKRALEEQFLEIMKRSNSVQDALGVQRELANVRGEIEKIEGRKRFLENQSSLSTIKIKLQTPTAFAGNSSGFFQQLGDAVSTGLNGALSFILVLVTALIALLPFFLFIVLPIYLLMRYLVRKNRKQKLASEIAREEIKNQ